ncbi:MAG: hypothetical protein IPJ19_03130 [Planctomycetes bacterium]|nr:hypothetical protein [Planctomycetota bacterium]
MSEGQPERRSGEPRERIYRGPDRRKRATPRFSLYSIWGGRRTDLRRTDERDGTFVDVYTTRLWMVVMWVVLMNIADSFFTLVHLQNGGVEANPMAQMLLQTGREGFVFWKCGLIGVALVVLTIHKNFPMARLDLWVSAGAYTLLLCYHVALFFC